MIGGGLGTFDPRQIAQSLGVSFNSIFNNLSQYISSKFGAESPYAKFEIRISKIAFEETAPCARFESIKPKATFSFREFIADTYNAIFSISKPRVDLEILIPRIKIDESKPRAEVSVTKKSTIRFVFVR